MPFGLSRAASFSGGGTISGSLTINGDLTVNGDGSGNYDEIVNGNLTISSTNKLVLGGDGSDTYLQESGADVLDIYVGGANMIKLTESSTDTVLITGDLTVGVDDTGNDVRIYSATASEGLFYDASEDELGLLLTTKLKFHDIGGGEEIYASSNGHLEINAGTTLDITAPTVDLNSATEFNIDTAAYDLNASGAVEVDGAGVSIDGTDDSNLTVTGSNKDLAVSVAGGSTQTLTISSAGTGTNAIDINATAGGIDIDANGAISLDSAAGSIDMNVVDGQTVAIGLNGAVETLWKPHGTAGNELWSTINTAGTTDGSDAAGSILLSAVAGGIGIAWADGKDLWAEGGRAVITANEDAADAIKLHADAGTSQTITIVNDAGTGASAIGLTASAGGVTVGLGGGSGDDFNVDSNTFVVESDNNRVGIGTASPSALLDVHGIAHIGSSTELTISAAGVLTVNNTTDATNSTSGSVIIDGGVGIAKKLYVGTDLDVEGTANLDDVDIDGAVDMASTLAVGGALTVSAAVAGGWHTQLNNTSTGSDANGLKINAGDVTGEYSLLVRNQADSLSLLSVKADGKIGMGTDAPDGDLHIMEADTTHGINAVADNLIIEGTGAIGMTFASDADMSIAFSDNDANLNGRIMYDISEGDLTFWTNELQRLIIDDSGKVGIGVGGTMDATANPSSTLHLKGANTAPILTIQHVANSGGDFGANDKLGEIRFGGHEQHDETEQAAQIGAYCEAAWDASNQDTYLQFDTRDGETTSTRLKLDTNSRISLSNNDLGDNNTVFGKLAGAALADGGNYNVLIGDNAGNDLTTGDENVIIGMNAGDAAVNVDRVTIVGTAAGSAIMTAGAGDGTGADETVAVGYASLAALTSGSGNTAVGAFTLDAAATSDYNTAVGWKALSAVNGSGTGGNVALGYNAGTTITDGVLNVAIGASALQLNAQSDRNVAVGYATLYNTTADSVGANVAVGVEAGFYNVAGVNNTYVGYNAGMGTTTANQSNNVAVGKDALKAIQAVDNNVAIGSSAGVALTTGASNVTLGTNTLATATTALKNTVLGHNAMVNVKAGVAVDGCVAIGFESLYGNSSNTTGINGTVAIGNSALKALTTGADNTAVGELALNALTIGAGNVAVGTRAADVTVEGTYNTAIGSDALATNVNGDNNTAVGQGALFTFNSANEGKNTAIGSEAGGYVSTGQSNTFVGYRAGQCNSSTNLEGDNNTAIGDSAGLVLQGAAANNTYVGKNAGAVTTTGVGNVAIGSSSLGSHTSSNYNTSIGYQSMYSAAAGAGNTAVGYESLKAVESGGTYNVAVGYQAGLAITTGDNNTTLGTGSGAALTTGGSNVIIGKNAGVGTLLTSNCVIIGAAAGEGVLTAGANGNIMIGYAAGNAVTIGGYNTIIGYQAADGLTEGQYNTVLGYEALGNATSAADQNTAIGRAAMSGAIVAEDVNACVAVGDAALAGALDASASGATAVGKSALGALTGGAGNVAVGFEAGGALSISSNNVIIGYQAMTTATTASDNNVAIGYQAMNGGHTTADVDGCVAIGRLALGAGSLAAGAAGSVAVGREALEAATSGAKNVAIGLEAATAITIGGYNVAIGSEALYTEDIGNSSTAVGFQALYSQNSNSNNEETGNTALGWTAGYYNVEGNNNTYLGTAAGKGVSGKNHSGCVFVGKDAGLTAYTGAYNIAIGYQAMDGLPTDDDTVGGSAENIFIGKDAGGGTWTTAASHYNVGIGNYTMDAGMNEALNNVALGHQALSALTSGDNNVCIGKDSGLQLAAAADNVMVGSLTGDAMTTQSNCTLIGSYAGTLIDHNDANGTTLIGYNACGRITQGQRNIAIGYEALDALAAGDQNVAIGHQALTAAANDEIGNICIGYLAGDSINHASADYNVFIGDQAGRGGLGAMIGCIGIGANALNSTTSNAQTGSVAIGHNALPAVTSGVGNVAVGYSAGSPVTTGSYSTAVGHVSLGVSAANVITGNFNTCLGYRAGYDIEGTSESNTIVGANTGAALTTGVRNTLMGKSAGGGLTTTGNNVAIGYDALGNASNADYVIAIGNGALDALAGNSHAGEVAIGHNALGACTAGGENLAIGYSALSAMTTGGDNIAIGYNAMLTANASTADKNIAIGNYALDATSTNNSNQNVAIGHQAGTAVTTGDDNVLVGYQAGETLAAGTNNTLIGSGAAAGATGATNQTAIGKSCTAVNTDNSVTLGNADVTAVYMAQDSGATVYAAGCVIDDGNHTNIYIGGSTSTTYNVVSTNGTLGAGHVGIAGGASGDNNLYLNCATGGGFIFREQESTHMKLDTSGNLGIGDTSPDAHLDVEDATLTATADYVGIYSNHIKTGGSTDNNHAFDGIKSDMTFNDSSNSFAYLRGLQVNSVSTTTAAEESISVIGINTLAKMAGSTDVNWIKGLELMTDVDAGTVDSDVFGIDVEVDIDGGTLSGNVFGQKLNINSTVNPSGNVFGQQIFMEGSGLDASADMFLYCYDGQNSDTTAQITALAGVATFDSGDFSGAPDYAEYFESKDGNPIAIGKTVKLDGDKIVACSDGDTPMGVIRPKASSGVVCNAATMRYQGKYLKTDYDEIIMEDYEIKNWKEDISFEEYIKRGKDDTGGVLGGNVKDEKVDGSEAKDAVLDEDGNELEPAVDAVADTYFREHSYHSDRIPDGLTVPDDAKTLTPNHQRKKLNPDYDPSQEYVKRADRDEWCLVGLLGQIPITKGQPTGNWIKMKDVSDTVEMYFVK